MSATPSAAVRRPRSQRPSPAVYRRRRLVVFAGGGLALLLAFYLPLAIFAPLRAAVAQPLANDPPAAVAAPLVWPGYGGAAIGAVGYPGVLVQHGSTEPLPMASITKVITAMVVLDKMPLASGESGPTYRTTAKDVELYSFYLAQNGKIAPARPGLDLTERQLLELTLVESANNYTMALALWAFGSTDAYLDAADAWLAERDLQGIRLTEPTGIDPGNAASTTDLVELGRIALADPIIAEIVSTDVISIPGVGELDNTNELLGTAGVDGIKTGTLDGFGANLLFSAEYLVGGSSVQVVGAVLGGPDHDVLDRDIALLLGGVSAGFREVEVAAIGEAFASYETVWGARAEAVAAESATLLVWSDTPISTATSPADLRPGSAGAALGSVTFSSGPKSVTVPLVLSVTVEDPGPLWRLFHPADLF